MFIIVMVEGSGIELLGMGGGGALEESLGPDGGREDGLEGSGDKEREEGVEVIEGVVWGWTFEESTGFF